MQVPLEITFRGVQKTTAIEDLIRRKADNLEKVCNHLVSCRIAVEKPQKHQRMGNPFRVRIDLRVPPGHEIVIKRESSEGDLHDELTKVLHNAFEAARRQLQELVRRQRAEVKTHAEEQNMAFVVRLFPEQGYGFLKTPNDREIYFHRNSVLHNDFDRLEIGTGVRFVEELGEKGAQASTVQIINKPGGHATGIEETILEAPRGWQE